MISDITLGQFFPGDSLLHHLDPRTKIIASILYMTAVFCAKNLFMYTAMILLTVAIILAGHISLRQVLRSLRPLVWVLLITGILNLFFTSGEGEPLFSFWFIRVYTVGIWRAILMAVRVLLLVAGTSVLLTYTTSPIRLTDGLESLLSPLKKLHVPVHEFAMMMTIALRFIPTLIEETDKIMKAQKARGADFSSGGLIRRAKALIPVLVPLFVSSFQHAMDLATAMECRCYHGGDGRTKLHELRFGKTDLAVLLFSALVLAGIILGNRFILIGNVI